VSESFISNSQLTSCVRLTSSDTLWRPSLRRRKPLFADFNLPGMSSVGKITLLPILADTLSALVGQVAHELLHRSDRRMQTTRTVRETEAVAFGVSSTIPSMRRRQAAITYSFIQAARQPRSWSSLRYVSYRCLGRLNHVCRSPDVR